VADPYRKAADALARGGLVVVPTDTVYGVAARPDLPEATARVFAAKGRPRDLTLPVLAAGAEAAGLAGHLDERALSLAGRFWPGPLTLVVPRTESSAPWDLGEGRDTIGLRVPDHRWTRALLAETGPLAVTSANRSGEPTPPDCEGVRAALGEAVEVYVCDDPRPAGPPSTVLDLTGPEPLVLREGALDRETLLAPLR
jgi:tRNA threonylcarbamoyl adenosine modification protein (Sua5/YciO/YrdC/YwlC family)